MRSGHYFFSPSTYDQSLPQVNTTRTAIVNALRSKPLNKHDVVIDVWCRTGQLAEYIQAKVKDVFAYDDEDEMIAFANKRTAQATNTHYKKCDFTSVIESPDVTADILVSSWHMPMIPEEKHPIYLSNLFNHLKPDGRLILLFPTAGSKLSEAIQETISTTEWQHYFAHVNSGRTAINPETLSTQLENAGFETTDILLRAVKHVFNNTGELKHFITTALSRQLPHLNEKDLRDKLVSDVTTAYLGKVDYTDKRIPYQVNMLTTVTRRPALTEEPIYMQRKGF